MKKKCITIAQEHKYDPGFRVPALLLSVAIQLKQRPAHWERMTADDPEISKHPWYRFTQRYTGGKRKREGGEESEGEDLEREGQTAGLEPCLKTDKGKGREMGGQMTPRRTSPDAETDTESRRIRRVKLILPKKPKATVWGGGEKVSVP